MTGEKHTERLNRRIKKYDRYKSAVKWAFFSMLWYMVAVYGPVPEWLAWEARPVPVVVFIILGMAGFGYAGMWVWQWMEPTEEALSAEDIDDGE